MLLKTSYTKLSKSEYECDRCKKKGTAEDMVKVLIQRPSEKYPKKKWDLCLNCYRSLVRGIKKGVNKNE